MLEVYPLKKKTNCGNAIAEIGKKKNLVIVAMPLPKMGGKKKLEWNCSNGIAEIGEFFFFLSIVAMSLPKMEGKKNVVVEIWGGI